VVGRLFGGCMVVSWGCMRSSERVQIDVLKMKVVERWLAAVHGGVSSVALGWQQQYGKALGIVGR